VFNFSPFESSFLIPLVRILGETSLPDSNEVLFSANRSAHRTLRAREKNRAPNQRGPIKLLLHVYTRRRRKKKERERERERKEKERKRKRAHKEDDEDAGRRRPIASSSRKVIVARTSIIPA
jgi:hypothetical protein